MLSKRERWQKEQKKVVERMDEIREKDLAREKEEKKIIGRTVVTPESTLRLLDQLTRPVERDSRSAQPVYNPKPVPVAFRFDSEAIEAAIQAGLKEADKKFSEVSPEVRLKTALDEIRKTNEEVGRKVKIAKEAEKAREEAKREWILKLHREEDAKIAAIERAKHLEEERIAEVRRNLKLKKMFLLPAVKATKDWNELLKTHPKLTKPWRDLQAIRKNIKRLDAFLVKGTLWPDGQRKLANLRAIELPKAELNLKMTNESTKEFTSPIYGPMARLCQEALKKNAAWARWSFMHKWAKKMNIDIPTKTTFVFDPIVTKLVTIEDLKAKFNNKEVE